MTICRKVDSTLRCGESGSPSLRPLIRRLRRHLLPEGEGFRGLFMIAKRNPACDLPQLVADVRTARLNDSYWAADLRPNTCSTTEMRMEARLQRVLDAHPLSCGAVIAASGDVVVRVGDFAAFASDGLVSALLSPYGSADTFDSVQGAERLLPRMWAQGDEFAFVDRADDLVIVVFGHDGGDVRAQYELSKAVGRSIAAEFTS